MFLKLHQDAFGRSHWYASTQDGQYDAVGNTPLDAVARLAEHLEEDLTPANDLLSDDALNALRAKLGHSDPNQD